MHTNISGRTYMKKTGVSRCFCTASASENCNQTTESYAQEAAKSALVVGGCNVVTRRITVAAERAVRGSTREQPC